VTDDSGPGVALARDPGDRAIVADDGTRTDVDVVFPILHGPFGEDGTIQGVLELAGVPYVGAGVLASAVGMDKAVQKTLFAAAGLPIVAHEVVRDREWEEDRESVEARAAALGLPLFVKPAALGSSVGISKVKQLDQFAAAIEVALSYGTKAVVERSAEGAREIECAVLGNDDPVASLPGEILTGEDADFYDYRAKYLDDTTGLRIPADVPDEIVGRVQAMAVAAFQAVDAAGMARVDFFYREPNEVLVNEINTIPGFTPVSMYPKMWEASGLPYADLIERLIDLAVERHNKERKRGRGL
jgi:D-alanine-D-alanine ligase